MDARKNKNRVDSIILHGIDFSYVLYVEGLAVQVNPAEAETLLPNLVAAVEQGEEVILARDGVPVAKLIQYGASKIKPPGAWKGKVPYSEDWNSSETNADVERLFLGEGDENPS